MTRSDSPRGRLASRLWNRDMMSTARDFDAPGRVRLRYAILSAPRSGSTLLARALYRTGNAGDPHEYLNPSAIAAYQAAGGKAGAGVREYLREIEARRTSPNGYFGIKVHYFHLSRLGGTEEAKSRLVQAFLQEQDRRILITRRDKLAQAVSYDIAQRSGRWTSEHEKYLGEGTDAACVFDPVAAGRCLQRIVEDEEGWRRTLASTGLPFVEVVFEDLVTRYVETVARVSAYLGIDVDGSLTAPALAPTTSPMAAGLREQFRRYLCGE